MPSPVFQLTAARRRLRFDKPKKDDPKTVSTHSRSKAAAIKNFCLAANTFVSTHSRSKAAASGHSSFITSGEFQLTAARRRLQKLIDWALDTVIVSTHSRSKAAAVCKAGITIRKKVSTHSRSKAAALALFARFWFRLCFNSQPLEGGCRGRGGPTNTGGGFQLTAARRRLPTASTCLPSSARFQLTAARRRLHPD